MKNTSRLGALAAGLVGVVTLAHGGMEHLKGVIAKVDGTTLTLTNEKGSPVVIQTDARTEFTRGAAKVALKDVAVGDKAVIHAVEHDEHFLAKVVKLAPAAATPSSDGGNSKHAGSR